MRWTRTVAGIGSFGQALVVARIAGLDLAAAWPLLFAAVAGAVLLARTGPAAAWMIGWGGLGMALGWWADLGFGTAVDAVRLGGVDAIWCHAPALGSTRFAVPGLWHLASWMNAGMLLFAIPVASRWMRPAPLLRCTIGMAFGMSAGSWLAAFVAAGSDPAAAVIVDYAAMSAGMVAGMFALERMPGQRAQMPRNAAIATRAQPATVTRNPSAPA
jgi:hypothetical protein